MVTYSLNGIWSYRIGKGAWGEKTVPSSCAPVGHSEYMRTFDCDLSYENIFLRFDGITYSAKVSLNGAFLGNMLPYAEYTFDVREYVKEKDNTLVVEIEDISPIFGPSEGWENYGGIIHDVSLLLCEKNYVKSVFFKPCFNEDFTVKGFTLDVETALPDTSYTVSLSDASGTLAEYSTDKASFFKECPVCTKLWSPDEPNLYTLRVSIDNSNESYSEDVGFKTVTCDNRKFYLNGKPIFFYGVCKHEMYGEYGHTVPKELIEKDMRMIKDIGCNFVRLVHYPHSRDVLDIADKVGLLVSEEPGLWWSDLSSPQIQDESLEVLRRTVLRDRNRASIAFWLSFNECHFDEVYMTAAAKVCRDNDGTRLVSGANCMNDEDTKKYFNKCGFDFYTTHPYSNTVKRAERSAEVLCEKPLIFTEWGGHDLFNNPKLMSEFIAAFGKLYRDGKLSGAVYWSWANMYEFGRGRPACVDGVLYEGLVDTERNKMLSFDAFVDSWHDIFYPPNYADTYWYEPKAEVCGEALAHISGGEDSEKMFTNARAAIERYPGNKRFRRMKVGPMLRNTELAEKPFILSDGCEIVFGGAAASRLSIVGAVSMPKGYPIGGDYGEEAAKITVSFVGGEEKHFTLRNGIDFTTAMMTYGPSRIDPVAENTERFAIYGYDKNHENYIINKLDLSLEKEYNIESVRFTSLNKGYDLLVYGVYAVK